MGQAAVDLPDPLEPAEPDAATATAAAPITSADDLLSQLAGEEIDRLLAEAEMESAPSAPETPAAEASAPESPASEPVAAPPVAATPAAPEPSADAVESSDTSVATQIDSALNAPAGEKSPAPAQSSEQVENPPAPEADASNFLSAERELAETENASPATTIAQLADELAASEQSAAKNNTSSPFYVRVLEMLDAPFAAIPDPARDAMGKVALLTLFNAAAVLIYVLMFRRHH